MKPSCTAAIETTGIAALRKACLRMILGRLNPFARAGAKLLRCQCVDHS
ncbi:hypothetical protein ACVWWO_005339 [Bradyrhizobium sp. F1.13.1]